MMKKLVCFFSALCCVVCLHAQNTAAQKSCVKEVREMYQDAQKQIAENNRQQETNHDMVVNIRSMEAGIGMQNTTFRYYFQNIYVGDLGTYVSQPYFVSKSYNVAARKCYEEYLFDPFYGTLRFVYYKWEISQDKFVEERYYLGDNGKLVWHQVKNRDDSRSEDDLKHEADKLRNAFFSLKGGADG